MSNITNVLLGHGTAYGENIPGGGQVANLATGGGFGYAADIANYLNEQPHVRQQGILFLIDIPNIYKAEFKLVQNPESWSKAWLSLLETRTSGISGFTNKWTTEVGEYQMDATGSKFWEIPIGTNIARSSPSFTWPADFIGRPLETMFKHLTRVGIKDPNTRQAAMHTILQRVSNPTRYTLADMWTFTYIFAQPDSSGKVIEEAYLVRNSFNKETPNNETTKSVSHIGIEEITIPFTGLIDNNNKTKQLAQMLLDRSMLTGIADSQNMPIKINASDNSLDPNSNIPRLNVALGETGSYKASVDVTRQPEVGP